MAGGKETPRQKMIGMMYLVLTAILALNVSQTILDAFVAIEENTQKSNITQVDRGNELISEISGEIATTRGNENRVKLQKLKRVLSQMKEVDVLTAKLVQEIDQVKLEILKESGENVEQYKPDDKKTILWQKGKDCAPIRMNLMAIDAKDEYDVPMYVIIGDDIKEPTGKGIKIWNDYNNFRSKLVQTVGTYKEGEKSFSINPKAINDFKDISDLKKKVEQMLKSSKANLRDDEAILSALYVDLTKPERVDQNDMEGVHWIGRTFDHSPLVAALASLSSLQQDILSARALALAHLKTKVGIGEFSFNSIVGLAYGPAVANMGDDVELNVMMAAFDSDNQPTVTYNGTSFKGTGGKGVIKAKAGSGSEMVLNGTVSIKNKAGLMKTENWSHTVKIMRPQGTVSLPQLNVLYKGYENKIEGVASGYDQTVLIGNGVSLTKSGNQHIAKVTTSGKSATIDVFGVNSVTKKRVKLGTFSFRVMRLPDPEFFFGLVETGGKIPTGESRLFARYKNSPLDAKFDVLSWELSTSTAPRPEKGKGNQLSAEGLRLIKQARSGSFINLRLEYMGPDKTHQWKTIAFVV
ncbi:GldM family protein [Fluviicola sp.]|uniref:type IX secretion system motor protein PorM/GldM n=1 Tax=Fluviicola sp. TaxID=1917219 RepID=UPI002608B565|nr:GldM family protein [Fluviicola sp.]